MARNRESLAKRNRQIAEEYARMFFAEGKRDGVIFPVLAERYYLRPYTVERIVLREAKKGDLGIWRCGDLGIREFGNGL